MTAGQVSSYSLVVCVFCKILQLLFWLRYRFSDVLRQFKLCKLAKVSYTRVSNILYMYTRVS